MSEAEQDVLTERRGKALWITINREARRNAINPAVIAGIHDAMIGAAVDPSVRVIVLTGAGSKAFCAGADRPRGTKPFALGRAEPMTDFGKLARFVRDCAIPTIARVNGDCVAG